MPERREAQRTATSNLEAIRERRVITRSRRRTATDAKSKDIGNRRVFKRAAQPAASVKEPQRTHMRELQAERFTFEIGR